MRYRNPWGKIRKLRGARQVCYHSATQSPQFDVSVLEKLLKIVATRGEIFSLKFTKYRRDGRLS